MKAHFASVHWSRVLLTGLLVSILALILNTVLLVAANSLGSQHNEIAGQVASWSTAILASLLVGISATRMAHEVERQAPLHGLLVGMVAALILFIFNPNVTNYIQGVHHGSIALLLMALGTFVLMVAAGWLGGTLGSPGHKRLVLGRLSI